MPEMDDKARLLEYLRQQQERRARQDDPAYRKSVNADLMGAQNVSTGNNLAALLMDSASMAGTLGGKRADASGVARFAAAQNDAMNDFRRGMAGEEQARENRYQMDAKVREYLAAKQQAGEDRAATAKYRADTLAQNASAAKAREEAEARRFAATQGLEREKMAQAAALKREELAASPQKDGKVVSSEMAANVGNLDAAQKSVDELERSYLARASGAGAGMKSMVKGTDANMYEKEADMAAQAIGQILEGGKLTETDFDRYRSMMPRASDTNAQARDKIQNLRRVLAEKKAGSIAGFTQAGYSTKGFADVQMPPQRKLTSGDDGTAIAAPVAPSAPPPGKVRVLSPDGKPGFIPAEQLQEALKEGYQEVK